MPLDLTCSSCDHHAATTPGFGECRAIPPTMPKHVAGGFVLIYGLTANDLPACGAFKPKAKAEPVIAPAPVLETKAEVKDEPKPAPAPVPEPAPKVPPSPPQRDQRRRTGR